MNRQYQHNNRNFNHNNNRNFSHNNRNFPQNNRNFSQNNRQQHQYNNNPHNSHNNNPNNNIKKEPNENQLIGRQNSKAFISEFLMEQIFDKAVEIAEQPDNFYDQSRKWLTRSDMEFEPSGVKVLTYNLMHESNICKKKYWGFELKKFNYMSRMKHVLQQIKDQSPDIINFQEVQKDCQDLKNHLEELGYEVVVIEKEQDDLDTLMTCWKREKYEKVHVFTLNCNNPNVHTYFNKQNVNQICQLKNLEKNNEAQLVVNSHILSCQGRGTNLEKDGIGHGIPKLMQMMLLIKSTYLISKQCGDECAVSVVWAGNFAVTPNSPIYSILTRQILKLCALNSKRQTGEFFTKDQYDAIYEKSMPYYVQTLNIHYKVSGKDQDQASQPSKFDKANPNYNRFEHMDVQSFMDRVLVSLNEYGELCYELINTDDLSGIPKLEVIFQELQFKSAYNDCVKNTVMEAFKTGFKNSGITDKWLQAEMCAEKLDPTCEPWMTSVGGGMYTRMCKDYILFARVEAKDQKAQTVSQSLRCRSVLQLPQLEKMLANTNMPNRFNPSDHYLLCCDLGMSTPVEKFNLTNLLETGFKEKPKDSAEGESVQQNIEQQGVDPNTNVLGKRDESIFDNQNDMASKIIKTDAMLMGAQNGLGGFEPTMGLDDQMLNEMVKFKFKVKVKIQY